MTYAELIVKLQAAEKATGLYLSDECVDVENAGQNATDRDLFQVAANAAGVRAEEAGYDINKLIGVSIY
jgi:hypothetical protein